MAKKILLAEDSVTMQKVVQMTFAAEDFTVSIVDSGEKAILQAKDLKPDIVIADLSMDDKTGYDVCAAIKADPILAPLPVLLMHGSAAPYDVSKGKAVRADGEISKPFESQALIDKVKDLTSRIPVAKEAMGPVESLAPPIETVPQDIIVDTVSVDLPGPAEEPAAARIKPAAPAPAAPAPAAAKPPVVQPPKLARPPVVAPPKGPPRPPPGMPAPPMPMAKPAAPKPAFAPKPYEIVIEAEPPPPREGPDAAMLEQSFRTAQPPPDGPLYVEPQRAGKPGATLMGMGVPEPPPPSPVPKPEVVLPAPPPGMPPISDVKAPPVRPGEPYEPAAVEAITKLSREIIERIVWEVVPDLAEKIIREELDRLVEKRRS